MRACVPVARGLCSMVDAGRFLHPQCPKVQALLSVIPLTRSVLPLITNKLAWED